MIVINTKKVELLWKLYFKRPEFKYFLMHGKGILK